MIDLNTELQRLIDRYNKAESDERLHRNSIEAQQEEAWTADALVVFCQTHAASLRVLAPNERVVPLWPAGEYNSDAPRPDLDAGR